jgi:hypothetical protein
MVHARPSRWRMGLQGPGSTASSPLPRLSRRPALSCSCMITVISAQAAASRAATSIHGGRSPTGGERSPIWRAARRSMRTALVSGARAMPAGMPSCSARPTDDCAALLRRCRRSAATSKACGGSRPMRCPRWRKHSATMNGRSCTESRRAGKPSSAPIPLFPQPIARRTRSISICGPSRRGSGTMRSPCARAARPACTSREPGSRACRRRRC